MGYGIKDTPWHEVIVKNNTGDERRDKTRCKHFIHLCKKEGYCSIQCFKCTGSAHCDFYEKKSTTFQLNLGNQKVTRSDIPNRLK